MQIFGDVSALSDFRKRALLARLRKLDKNIVDVTAEYLHFVDGPALSAVAKKQLQMLLAYGTPFDGKPAGQLVLVVPRPGTISPWSSKATNIAHNAGLMTIKRIERGVAYYVRAAKKLQNSEAVAALLHDRMTETVLEHTAQAEALFKETEPKPVRVIDILGPNGKDALTRANTDYILALAPDEIDYLYQTYGDLGRNPTDAELMMFGVVNSEHCRHKVFNASWHVDGKLQAKSLFGMIKNTHQKSGDNVLSAYADNAAVLRGGKGGFFAPDPKTKEYESYNEQLHIVIKAETHNHPTAIAPFPGAATGTGGEIRDEAATGRGARSKMGLAGYSVSNLMLPGALRPWERGYGKPERIVSAQTIMIEAPLGTAAFANEFGRPNLAGYFRTYEQTDDAGNVRGYHKPLMIAGGLGVVREQFVQKKPIPVGAKLIVLGGPAMLIGLGGGSGSSVASGASRADLDFASVQRPNGEMQRRAQEVINACVALGKDNPIVSIHDVGAGGLSNALPELVHDSGRGATFELRKILNAEPGMSPMEIWCNEAQERYVLAIEAKDELLFQKLCERERCPYAVVGTAAKQEHLILHDSQFNNSPVDIPMAVLFGKPPKMVREVSIQKSRLVALETADINLEEAVQRVLQLPAVGSKKFLIIIGDRTVSGLVARDQMVGPWQVPVSDVAVTARAFDTVAGEAMAMGERTPLALINSPAAARIAIGEAITNMAAADIAQISDIKLSANWMAAIGTNTEDQKLWETVQAVGEAFCPALGITIPVGKDSLSMQTVWQDNGKEKSVTSPLSLIISGFAPVADVTKTLTPQLQKGDSVLIAVDLGEGQQRLGGSALAQVYNQLGNQSPDVSPETLKHFFATIQKLKSQHIILAYHDRSDGGLFAALCEMAFAARTGLNIVLDDLPGNTLQQLFSEELGAVLQVPRRHQALVLKELGKYAHVIGKPASTQQITFTKNGQTVYRAMRSQLEQWWADTSYRMQALRDNPNCAHQEFEAIADDQDPGLLPFIPFRLQRKIYKTRPKVAIFREQGVNGQVEMAAAFDRAGFTAVDVHVQDLLDGNAKLKDFVGLAVCGGFSYGDVLGAGEGWAKSILQHKKLRQEFETFFHRQDTFSFGVCNGCQMLAALKELVPGAEHWPRFLRNQSEQFEARLVMVKVNDSPSIMFRGMAGANIPVPTAHGEGLASFATASGSADVLQNNLAPLQYVDNRGQATTTYPFNPNGSPAGITALTSLDGRATIMMPHPERVFLTKQFSWHPKDWEKDSPWFQLFQNVREWVS